MIPANLLPHRNGEVGIRAIHDPKPRIPAHNAQFRQFLRLLDRQTPQPYCIHQLKHGRIRANPQRQRKNRHRRKPRTLAKAAKSIPHIANQAVHAQSSILLANPLLGHHRIAKSKPGLAGSRFRAHPLRKVGVDSHLHMLPQFIRDFTIELRLFP
jgi:hypothetical protein